MTVTRTDGDVHLATAPTASWGRRVVATLLDHSVVVSAAFLGDGLVMSGELAVLPAFGPADQAGGPVTTLTVLTLLLMQAYLGATPGKLVMGLAVVHESDARPIGVVRTVLRWLCHLADAFLLMIGYLRPLWHPQRRTFADSIMGTLVLETTSPFPNRLLTRTDDLHEPGPPFSWQRPVTPSWRRWVRGVAAVVCAVGVVFAVGPTTGVRAEPVRTVARCTDDVAGSPLHEVRLVLVDEVATASWLGVTRSVDGSASSGWGAHGVGRLEVTTTTDAPSDAWLETTVESAAGASTHGQRLDDAAASHDASLWTPGATWQVELQTADGEVLGSCGGTVPRGAGV